MSERLILGALFSHIGSISYARILVLSFLLFPFVSFCQLKTHLQLTEEDGLPSNTVYQILKDYKGYVWLGTKDGLCQFDGNEVEKVDSEVLLDNEILQMQEGKNGCIWMLNGSGKVFSYQEGKISPFVFDFDFSVREFKIDTSFNNLWLVLEERIDTLDKVYEEKILFCRDMKDCELVDFPMEINRISFGAFEPKEIFFYGSTRFRNGKRAVYRLNMNRSSRKISQIDTVSLVNDQQFYFFTALNSEQQFYFRNNDYGMLNEQSLSQVQQLEQGKTINNIIYSERGPLFLTSKGLCFSELNEFKYSEFNAYAYLKGEEDVSFIGTKDNGLLTVLIEDVVKVVDSPLLKGQEVYKIQTASDGSVLVGAGGQQLLLFSDEGEVIEINGPKKNNIIEQISDQLWIIGNETELSFLNLETKQCRPFIANDYTAKSLLATEKNGFWLGQNHFLIARDEYLGDIYSKGKYEMARSPNVVREKIIKLVEIDNLAVLGGGPAGLFLLKQANGFIDSEKIYEGSISTLSQQNAGLVYFHVKGEGLFKYNVNQKTITKFSEQLNYATREIIHFKENILIATNQGVAIFSPQTQKIEDWINKYDGLPSNDVNTIALGEDDKLWIGTKKGLAIVDLTKLTKNTTPPPVYITNVKIMEQDTTLHGAYTLSYNQNNIQIDYVGLAYRARGDVRYKYRMKGIDTTWVMTKSRYARFPALQSGDYTFEVIALNEDDTASAAPATVSFYITPPYWQTWWFWGLGGSVVFGTLGWLGYRRFLRIQKEQAFEQQISALKMEALQSQMNPHFIFNALNAVQSFITSGEDEQAMFYLAKFAQLIRSIFKYSSKAFISLDEEISFLNLYLDLERLRFGDRVSAALYVEPALLEDAQDINVPPLLIQPIVENAFKHGLLHKQGLGNLSIRLTFVPDNHERVLCIVEDNGVGRAYTQKLKKGQVKHNSAGLTVTKNRLSILHKGTKLSQQPFHIKDLLDQNQKQIGTRVEIIL